MSIGNIIQVTHLTHRLGDGRLALDRIDLNIPRGAFVVIAGPNGSGKTTLLRYFNGLYLASKGRVVVDGIDVRDDVRGTRTRVGMVFQDADSQIVGETVWDDVAFGPENLSLPADDIRRAVDAALDWVGLNHLALQSPHLLSGGERRRLAIAGVLAMRPRVIVMDEPFANLDYPGIRQILAHIVRLHRSGHTIVISAHDLEKVAAHAQQLVILEGGRLMADGPVANVLPTVERFGIRLPYAARMGLPLESWLN